MEQQIDIQWLGRVEYAEALKLQETLAEQRLAGEVKDTILFLEHEPVYTIGRTRDQSSLRDAAAQGLNVVEISRGGQATYHGPGQLVGYLILDLNGFGKDLHTYLRGLEESLILACKDYSINAGRRDGLTGVWIENRKVASLGVGVRKWISMHGFAINIASDVSGFSAITPCGIADVEMTSVERESGKSVSVEEFSQTLEPHLLQQLDLLR